MKCNFFLYAVIVFTFSLQLMLNDFFLFMLKFDEVEVPNQVFPVVQILFILSFVFLPLLSVSGEKCQCYLYIII